MIKLLVIFITLLSTISAQSFSKSKKILLNEVYKENKATFYCNNPYEIKKPLRERKKLTIHLEISILRKVS